MEEYTRKTIAIELDNFGARTTHIECTDWLNGEGMDVSVNEEIYQFHYDVIDAIAMIRNKFNLREKKDE